MDELRRITQRSNTNAFPKPLSGIAVPSGSSAAKNPHDSVFNTLKSLFTNKPPTSTSTYITPAAKRVNRASVILPLYIFPEPNAWDRIFTNITSNSNLNFSIVINPNSGPGGTQYPEESYIEAIAQLNAFPNTQLHGYVHTTGATRAMADVVSDITAYQGWAGYAAADIHMEGIFFDEAPGEYTPDNINYMRTVYDSVKSIMGPGFNNVITNPGVIVDERYYDYADTINAFEDYYTSYSPTTTLETIPAAHRARTSMMIHDFDGSPADQNTIVQNLVNGGVQGLYISTVTNYDDVSTVWTEFCHDMAQS